MHSAFRFPNARTTAECICHHSLLNRYREKRITNAIAELAAKRFANGDRVEMEIKRETTLLINDLQTGEDSFTGKSLPNFGKLGLPSAFWDQMSIDTEKALLDCANKAQLRQIK